MVTNTQQTVFELIVFPSPSKNENFTWNVATNWGSNIRKLTGIYGDQEKFGDWWQELMLCCATGGKKDTGWPVDVDASIRVAPTQSAFKTKVRKPIS